MIRRNGLLCLALAAVLGAGGCSDSSSAGKPVDTSRSPDVVVQEAVGRRASLTSLKGNGTMKLVDRESNFGLTVNTEVIADRTADPFVFGGRFGDNPARLRIFATKMSFDAFDLVMINDDVALHVPREKALFQGSLGELAGMRLPIRPDQIVSQLLEPETRLSVRHWRPDEARAGDPSGVVAYREAGPMGRGYLRVLIDRRTGNLAAVQEYGSYGELYFARSFSDYRPLDRGRPRQRDAAATGLLAARPVLFPHRMKLEWPSEGRTAEIAFRSVEGDAVVNPDEFLLATPPGTREYPLQRAQVAGDGAQAGRSDADAGRRG